MMQTLNKAEIYASYSSLFIDKKNNSATELLYGTLALKKTATHEAFINDNNLQHIFINLFFELNYR